MGIKSLLVLLEHWIVLAGTRFTTRSGSKEASETRTACSLFYLGQDIIEIYGDSSVRYSSLVPVIWVDIPK